MKKLSLFDIIIYRFLLSLPVSCIANFIYGFMLFWALLMRSGALRIPLQIFEYKILFIFAVTAAIIPFILFNIGRYWAIKAGKLKYGIKGLILSSVPEYLFFIVGILLMYLYDTLLLNIF